MVENRILVEATVTAVSDDHFIYPCCRNCYSKMLEDCTDHRWHCVKCGVSCLADDLEWRYRLRLVVADTEEYRQVAVFGRTVQPFFGTSANTFHSFLTELKNNDAEMTNVVLKQAVNVVFVGQCFMFGFPSVGKMKPVTVSCLSHAAKTKGDSSDLIAVQMLAFNPGKMDTVARKMNVLFNEFLSGSNHDMSEATQQEELYDNSRRSSIKKAVNSFTSMLEVTENSENSLASLLLSCEKSLAKMSRTCEQGERGFGGSFSFDQLSRNGERNVKVISENVNNKDKELSDICDASHEDREKDFMKTDHNIETNTDSHVNITGQSESKYDRNCTLKDSNKNENVFHHFDILTDDDIHANLAVQTDVTDVDAATYISDDSMNDSSLLLAESEAFLLDKKPSFVCLHQSTKSDIGSNQENKDHSSESTAAHDTHLVWEDLPYSEDLDAFLSMAQVPNEKSVCDNSKFECKDFQYQKTLSSSFIDSDKPGDCILPQDKTSNLQVISSLHFDPHNLKASFSNKMSNSKDLASSYIDHGRPKSEVSNCAIKTDCAEKDSGTLGVTDLDEDVTMCPEELKQNGVTTMFSEQIERDWATTMFSEEVGKDHDHDDDSITDMYSEDIEQDHEHNRDSMMTTMYSKEVGKNHEHDKDGIITTVFCENVKNHDGQTIFSEKFLYDDVHAQSCKQSWNDLPESEDLDKFLCLAEASMIPMVSETERSRSHPPHNVGNKQHAEINVSKAVDANCNKAEVLLQPPLTIVSHKPSSDDHLQVKNEHSDIDSDLAYAFDDSFPEESYTILNCSSAHQAVAMVTEANIPSHVAPEEERSRLSKIGSETFEAKGKGPEIIQTDSNSLKLSLSEMMTRHGYNPDQANALIKDAPDGAVDNPSERSSPEQHICDGYESIDGSAELFDGSGDLFGDEDDESHNSASGSHISEVQESIEESFKVPEQKPECVSALDSQRKTVKFAKRLSHISSIQLIDIRMKLNFVTPVPRQLTPAKSCIRHKDFGSQRSKDTAAPNSPVERLFVSKVSHMSGHFSDDPNDLGSTSTHLQRPLDNIEVGHIEQFNETADSDCLFSQDMFACSQNQIPDASEIDKNSPMLFSQTQRDVIDGPKAETIRSVMELDSVKSDCDSSPMLFSQADTSLYTTSTPSGEAVRARDMAPLTPDLFTP